MNDFTLRQSLRALRTERQPPHDLWQQIAPRLPVRRRAPWLPLAMAASLLVALPALLVLMRPVAPAGPARFASEVVREADAMSVQYRAALAEVGHLPLPDALRGAADQLERQAEQLHIALESHPQSVELLHQLRRTYDHRLRLSQRVALG
ncbi:hypothetical protein [Pseudomarimonas salicorniae]|uniref:Uncharacterized protein n=1 Tax=Pseudomarimonas salicorniae TaxID=2933270 RepID=A0ABT0GC81_9GAMM|nr:hypothetical protein [Lysobacter sp. CAU 1642]MCK7592136.1 hypothetical protein [Lysobacter sp. CAU 1642]